MEYVIGDLSCGLGNRFEGCDYSPVEDWDILHGSNKDIKTVKLDGNWYVLDDWNGESYGDCWRVKDRFGFDRMDDNTYELVPVEKPDDEDETSWSTVGYVIN